MNRSEEDEEVTEATRLDLFCARQQDEAWRAYLRPGWQPRYLRQHLDEEGEAFPAYFDFDDLERHMREQKATLEKQTSTDARCVRLIARGASAEALAWWLSGVFGTCTRARGSDPGESI